MAAAPSTTVTRSQPPSWRLRSAEYSQGVPSSPTTSALGVPIRVPAPAASRIPSTRIPSGYGAGQENACAYIAASSSEYAPENPQTLTKPSVAETR